MEINKTPEATVYHSKNEPELEAVVGENGMGAIYLEGEKICDLDIFEGRMIFEDKCFEMSVPKSRSMKERIQTALVMSEIFIDHRFVYGIRPELTEADVFADCGFKTDKAHTEVYLSLTEEGKKDIYRKAELKAMTGMTYDEAMKDGYQLFVRAFSYFQDNSAKLLVELEDGRLGPEERRPPIKTEVTLPREQQQLINARVEEYLGVPIEENIAVVLTRNNIIKPMVILTPKINGDGSMSVRIGLTEKDLNDVMYRGNAYKNFGVENMRDYVAKKCSVEAILYLDGRVRMNLLGDGGKAVAVPLKEEEKLKIKKFVRKTIGRPYEEAIQEALDKKEAQDKETDTKKKAVKAKKPDKTDR